MLTINNLLSIMFITVEKKKKERKKERKNALKLNIDKVKENREKKFKITNKKTKI